MPNFMSMPCEFHVEITTSRSNMVQIHLTMHNICLWTTFQRKVISHMVTHVNLYTLYLLHWPFPLHVKARENTTWCKIIVVVGVGENLSTLIICCNS